MTQLIPLEQINAIEVFKDSETLQSLLDEIKKTATDFTPDTSTPNGRKEIASQAYKVSQSKAVIENAGKELVSAEKLRLKGIDNSRKVARDFCDGLRDEIRKPLTEYEDEGKRLAETAAQKAEMEADEIDAHAENDLFDREQKLLAAEAEIAANAEAARIEREEQEAEDRRIATEKRLKAEADERAQREAQQAIDDANAEVERERREREEEKERARHAEIEAAKQAERDRLKAIKDTEDRIERERIERERMERIESEKQERKANQKRHVSSVNKSVVASFVANGIDKETAVKIVELVSCESVDNIRINYLN